MNKHRINIPMCLASILFCLTLISVHFMGGLYAKYTATGSGSDSARVIKFGNITLTETGDFDNAENSAIIIPGVDLTKNATVSFEGSEAATFVFVEVVPEGWTTTDNRTFTAAGGGMLWSVSTEWTYLDETEYVYYMVLEPNTPLNNEEIIAGGTVTVDDNISKGVISSITNMTVDFRASVVQAGGFDSVSAAWDSIAAKAG